MKSGSGHFETTTWRSLQVLEGGLNPPVCVTQAAWRGVLGPGLCHGGAPCRLPHKDENH